MVKITKQKLQPTISAQTVTSGALEKCKGKTIADWEFGTVELGSRCHMSERVILHFTDGSSVTFDIGTNAQNLASDHKGLKPSDVHASIRAEFGRAGL
jgi:hypothetical protein